MGRVIRGEHLCLNPISIPTGPLIPTFTLLGLIGIRIRFLGGLMAMFIIRFLEAVSKAISSGCMTNRFSYLNLAVGGNYVGSPNADTVFPAEYLVDYIRVYQRN